VKVVLLADQLDDSQVEQKVVAMADLLVVWKVVQLVVWLVDQLEPVEQVF
jgi:hypothetical protein